MTEPPFTTGGPPSAAPGGQPGGAPHTPPGFGPPAPWGQPLAAQREQTRRRFLLVMAGFAVLLVVSAVGFVITAGPDIRDTAVGVRDGLRLTMEPRPTEQPDPTVDARRPVPKPVRYTGTGSKTLRIRRPEAGDAIVYVKGGNGSGLFTVTGFGAGGMQTGFVIAEIGSYEGVRMLDVAKVIRTTSLKIEATGRWVVEIRSPRGAKAFAGPMSGTGDSVVRYTGPGGTAAISGGSSMSAFTVTTYDDSGFPRVVVVSVGAFRGSKAWPAGPVLVEVKATGRWTIRV